MKDRRACPFCKAARMKVATSKRVGDSQVQRLECPSCGRNRTIEVPRAEVFPRNKSSSLEQQKPEILARVRKIGKRKKA